MASKRWFAIVGLLAAAFFLLALPLQAQKIRLSDSQLKELDRFIHQQMKVDKIPGLSIGYYQGDFFWAKGYGYADLENKTPAHARSAYRLASNTKSMTAVAILQLAEKGKLKLDDEIHKYVPYFPWKNWPITIRQLLGHLGGISHYKDYDVEGHIKEHKYTRDALAIFANFDLVAEPGTRYNYSSYGYNLLGAIVEGASGMSFGDYLRRHLWEPLDMNDTRMDDPFDLIPNRVRGYQLVFGEIKNSEFVDISSRFAAGGTRSTVPDLLKYAEGLANARVLTQKSLDEMETSMAIRSGYFVDYGMGWRIEPVNGHFMAYHTGGQPETRTLLVRFPTLNFAFALAYNLEGANLHIYGHRLYQLLMDEAWNIPVYTGNRIHDALYLAVWNTFNYGMAEFDRFRNRKLKDTDKLKAAFAYFNAATQPDSLRSSYRRFLKRIRDGRHPIADEAFVRVGAYMTQQLLAAKGARHLEKYHKNGALPFFKDYIELYRSGAAIPETYRFSAALEKWIKEFSAEWEKVWTPALRRLHIAVYEDLDGILRHLQKQFAGRKIYPNYLADFGDAVFDLLLQNETEKALNVAQKLAKLYPKTAHPHLFRAMAFAIQQDSTALLQELKQARKASFGQSAVSARSLARYARQFFRWNRLDEAELLLRVALKLYPRSGALWDTLGQIQLERSRRAFKKALRYSPTMEHPWKMLKKIK